MTGLVNQQLLRTEYLAAENRILRARLSSRLRLSDAERSTLAEIAMRLGRKALKDIAQVAKPDTTLGWYPQLVARKFDGSRQRGYPGRPRVSAEVEELVVRLARENRSWGYDSIVGALTNLGHQVSDKRSATFCAATTSRQHRKRRRGRTTTWKEFLQTHMDVLAGADFFTVEALTWRGLVTYYVLLPRSRQPSGTTGPHHAPSGVVVAAEGSAQRHDAGQRLSEWLPLPADDRDPRFCREFRETLAWVV